MTGDTLSTLQVWNTSRQISSKVADILEESDDGETIPENKFGLANIKMDYWPFESVDQLESIVFDLDCGVESRNDFVNSLAHDIKDVLYDSEIEIVRADNSPTKGDSFEDNPDHESEVRVDEIVDISIGDLELVDGIQPVHVDVAKELFVALTSDNVSYADVMQENSSIGFPQKVEVRMAVTNAWGKNVKTAVEELSEWVLTIDNTDAASKRRALKAPMGLEESS